jgi:hypothetical protein
LPLTAYDTNHSPLVYSGLSYRAEPENPKSIADCIYKVSLLTDDQREEICRVSKQYVVSNHCYEALAESFSYELM